MFAVLFYFPVGPIEAQKCPGSRLLKRLFATTPSGPRGNRLSPSRHVLPPVARFPRHPSFTAD